MYKAVIFDFDYTLGDSTNGIVLSINHALEKLGFRVQDTKTIQRTIGLSLKDTLFELTGIQDEETAQKFTQYFKEKADEVMVDNTRLYEGVLAMLKKLRDNKILLGIVTTKYHYRIEQIVEKNNAMSVIDVIIGRAADGNSEIECQQKSGSLCGRQYRRCKNSPERGRGFRGGIDRNDREGRVYEL